MVSSSTKPAPGAMLSRCHLLLLAALAIVTSCRPTTERRFQMCGHKLADRLAIVCNGSYHEPFGGGLHRRSAGTPHGRGIADECCRKGCSTNMMRAYCMNSPKLSDDTQSPQQVSSSRTIQPVKADQSVEHTDRPTPPPQRTTPQPARIGTVSPYYIRFVNMFEGQV